MLAAVLATLAACGAGGVATDAVTTGIDIEGSPFASTGSHNGVLYPTEGSYQVTNRGQAPVEWAVSADQSWVLLDLTGGALAPLQVATVDVSLTATAVQLPIGTHVCTLSFRNLTDGQGDTSREIVVTITSSPTVGISVEGYPHMSLGSQGGPFEPSESSYQVTNRGQVPVQWTVSVDQPWVVPSLFGGALAPLEAATVAVTLSSAASQLPPGSHTCTLSFVNLTDGLGDTSREVMVAVTPLNSVPMTTATRTTGVAPLAIVFDSVGAGNGVVQPSGVDPDYNSSSYLWDYGDQGSGVWQHNGKSKNRSLGYVGAHVYETPGTYRATLRVIDNQGSQTDYHQDIVVTDPSTVFATKTFHVAANGDDSNPGTVSQPFVTVARGIQEAFVTNNTARLLLRRGDVFSSGGISLGSAAGPFLIGAYGAGSSPRVEFPQQSVGLNAGQTQDLRLVDLEFVSTSATQDPWAAGISVGNRTSALRCSFSNFGTTVSINQKSGVAIVDCVLLNSTQYGIYATGVHLATMGNRFQLAGQHLLRTYISRSVIHANHFADAGGGFTALKLCGQAPATPSQFVSVTDNYLTTETIDVMNLGPENATSDQHIRFYLVEGNYFVSRSSGNHALKIQGPRVVVRNNVFDLLSRRGIQVDRWGIGPVPNRVRIENNTAYSSMSSSFRLLGNVDTSDLTVVRNNIIVAPNGSVHALGGTIAQANNLTTNAMMVAPTTGDFTLQAGSPAIDTGVGASVVVDFAGNPRPVGNGLDVGAFERQ